MYNAVFYFNKNSDFTYDIPWDRSILAEIEQLTEMWKDQLDAVIIVGMTIERRYV